MISATEADVVLSGVDPAELLPLMDELWTMTSGIGYEALLRGAPATCLGAPFYGGWRLTRDLGPVPVRRRVAVPLAGLVHAALIAYPAMSIRRPACIARPRSSSTGLKKVPSPGPDVNRTLAKLQGAFAGQALLWPR